MKDNSKYKSLDNIEKAMLESYLHDPNHAVEDLDAAGYNVNSLVAEGMDLINQYKFKQLVAGNKTSLTGLFDKAKALLTEKVKVNRSEALILLAKLQVKVQYRNIENFSDDELNEVLKDVDLVKLIEELEKAH
jgi:hypothetical protein